MKEKVYEITNQNGKFQFIGFEDYTNFGHGSESMVISTNDKRIELEGTRCYDIAGYQCFLPINLKEIKE